jgi:hypothetical protein
LGDIATEISAGLRCDSKKLKPLQKSHRAAARMRPLANEIGPLAEPPRNGIWSYMSAAARPKKRRVARPVPPAIMLDDHGTPIIMQGLPKRPARNEDHPKERAERPRTIARGSSS